MRLGASVEGDGVRFAVFSSVADAVELCLFDAAGAETRQSLERDDGDVWQAQVAGAAHGLQYGYRVHGPGRCDRAKLLLDPYARAIAGGVTWHPDVLALGADSAPYVPRSVVHDAPFDWGDDRRPRPRWPTRSSMSCTSRASPSCIPTCPGSPRNVRRPGAPGGDRAPGAARRDRGRAAAGAPVRRRAGARRARAAQLLGLPVDRILRAARRVAAGGRATSRRWSRRCTRPGLEVILDVVFNHTAEGGEDGPTLLLARPRRRRLLPAATTTAATSTTPAAATPSTRTGPRGLRLVMDSLRYWVRGDARRRLPLRPRREPWPRDERLRPVRRLPRRRRPGPGAVATSS